VAQAGTGKKTSKIITEAPAPLSPADQQHERLVTGIKELDRCLGAGIMPGAAMVISGPPGIGKSTLLTQLAGHLSQKNLMTVYLCGEEAPEQLARRAERMGFAGNPYFLTSTNTQIDQLLASLESLPTKGMTLIIDSMQTLFSSDLSGPPGSINQVRGCVHELVQWAKERHVTLMIVGHVTKDNQLAGPRVVEHLVDVVLQFEGDNQNDFRVLRASKNRFGNTSEIGLFDMTSQGLMSIDNPSGHLLQGRRGDIAGSVVFTSMEGTRPLLGELQALTIETGYSTPKRSSLGYDGNRLAMILAVMEARAGIPVGKHDVYVTVMGGLRIQDTALDLAVVAAVTSALTGLPLPEGFVAVGEIGLTGEVRSVRNLTERLEEAKRLGYPRGAIPAVGLDRSPHSGYSTYGHVEDFCRGMFMPDQQGG